MVISPAYAIFANGVIMTGGEPRAVPLAETGSGFGSTSIACGAPSTSRTRMLIVNSPSNPTGWMITDGRAASAATRWPSGTT